MKEISFKDLAKFFKKQEEALNLSLQKKFLLYGGSAGSGKSYFLRWACLFYALYYPSIYGVSPHIGLFCKSYPELEDRHLKYLRQEFPSELGEFKEQKKEFHLKPEYGGGIISFRNLDEVDKFLSAEWALIAIDEITEIPYNTFKILFTRLRFPGIDDTKIICASNPWGEHMLWVRQFFVEKNIPAEFEKYREEIAFLPALPTDNPNLSQSYFEQLKSLPERERRAFLEGDWYAFEGEIDKSGYIPLITAKELENVFVENEIEYERTFLNSDNVLGIDVGAGGDKSVLVLRNNFCAKILFAEKLTDTMKILPLIYNAFKTYKISTIAIDTTGVGRGIFDRLQEIGFYNAIPIVFGGKPETKDFFNKKAELFWKLREWLLKGGKLLKDDRFNDILVVKYKVQSDRKIRIIPKETLQKQGIPSHDVADALALTMSAEPSQTKELMDIYNYEKQW